MKALVTLTLFLSSIVLSAQSLVPGMPEVTGGSVRAFEKVGDMMYIGGPFEMVGDFECDGLARFNVTTGEVDDWAPEIGSGSVNSITSVAGKVVVGGTFFSVNGVSHTGICIFDHSTGELDPWSGSAFFLSWQQGVGVHGNDFFHSSGSATNVVSTNASTGTDNDWETNPAFFQQGSINAILVIEPYIYVGGEFGFPGGESLYSNLCRFHLETGQLDSTWHPQPDIGNFGVTTLVRNNDQIFVGGVFDEISGEPRLGVAAYDLDGNLLPFSQSSSAFEVFCLFPAGDKIWVGGNSWMLGGEARWRIAQIDIASSQATCWNASFISEDWSIVQAMYVVGDTVYLGPLGEPDMAVLAGGPLPLTPSEITGPEGVLPDSEAMYSIPAQPGYDYYWTITGGTGSSSTNSIDVTWGAGPAGSVEVYVDNPEEDNCSSSPAILPVIISESVSIAEFSSELFSIFPNPTTDFVTLDYPGHVVEEQSELKLIDALGKTVLRVPITAAKSRIDTGSLPGGLYTVLLTSSDRHFSRKLIVR